MTLKQARAFVKQRGIVLHSARHPKIPSVAEAVAGEAISGSWWSHPAGKQIFRALSAIDDDDDVVTCRLVAGKLTYVHRRLWPALRTLATAKLLSSRQLDRVQQEHLPSGKHINRVTPYPKWLPKDLKTMSLGAARKLLGGHLESFERFARRGRASHRDA